MEFNNNGTYHSGPFGTGNTPPPPNTPKKPINVDLDSASSKSSSPSLSCLY